MNRKNSSFNKFQISLSAGSHFITDMYQSFIIGLIPVLALKFDLSLFRIGLLTATSVIANSLFSPIFGYFSDRHGLKYYIIAGPLFTSIFLSLIGILPNYYFILAFLFLGNLSIAAYHPASAAVAGHFGGSKKGLGSSIINFGGYFGGAIGVLLIILIVEKLNMNLTPIAMIPGLITAIVLFKFVPNTSFKNDTGNFLDFFSRIKKMNKRKIYLLFLVLFTIYSLRILWITLITYMPLYYTGANITLINVGMIMFFFGMLGGVGGLLSGFLFDRFKKGNLIIQISFALATYILFYFQNHRPHFYNTFCYRRIFPDFNSAGMYQNYSGPTARKYVSGIFFNSGIQSWYCCNYNDFSGKSCRYYWNPGSYKLRNNSYYIYHSYTF